MDLEGNVLYDVSRDHHTYWYMVIEDHPNTQCDYYIYPPHRHGLRMLNLTTGQSTDLVQYSPRTPYYHKGQISPCKTKIAMACQFWGGSIETVVLDISEIDSYVAVIHQCEGDCVGWLSEDTFKIRDFTCGVVDRAGNLCYNEEVLGDWCWERRIELVNLPQLSRLHWISEGEYESLVDENAQEMDLDVTLTYRIKRI